EVAAKKIVDARDDAGGRRAAVRFGLDQAARHHHADGRADAVPGDIRDRDAEPSGTHVRVSEVVAADVLSGAADPRYLQARDLRVLHRQEAELDLPRDLDLALHALGFPHREDEAPVLDDVRA